MAGEVSVNTEAAKKSAGDLAAIRKTLISMGHLFKSYKGAMGSARVESALDDFFNQSSDNRRKVDALLKRSMGLLGKLAEGAEKIDKGLSDGLKNQSDTSQPAPEEKSGPQ